MNYSVFRFTLNMHNHRSQVSIPVFVGDTAVRLLISVTDGGNPYFIEDGCTAVIRGKKPDGKSIFNQCLILNNSTIQYDFTEQTANVEGITNCEIDLYDTEGKLVTAPKFIIVADTRTVPDYTIEGLISEEEHTAIEQVMSIVASEQGRVNAENARVLAETGRVEAEASRVTSEQARATAETERVKAENERVQLELAIIKSEQARVSAEEERATAEAERVKAEAERKTSLADVLRYSPQSLTYEQKVQARANIGALPSTYTPPNQTAEQVGADPKGTASGLVSLHNTSTVSHKDIRILLNELTSRLNALANSDDTTLDQLSEIVAYIKNNKDLIDGVTTSKLNVTDVINNLDTANSKKALSANQGVMLKALIDNVDMSLAFKPTLTTSEIDTLTALIQ